MSKPHAKAEVSRRSHLVIWRKLKSERSQLIHICLRRSTYQLCLMALEKKLTWFSTFLRESWSSTRNKNLDQTSDVQKQHGERGEATKQYNPKANSRMGEFFCLAKEGINIVQFVFHEHWMHISQASSHLKRNKTYLHK